MRGVNKVIIIGTLGRDPEIRYMPSGDAVGNLAVATSESWKDKQTNEIKEQTEWHKVVLYARLAEIAGEYLRKGSKVYLEGSLHTRKYQDKDGIDRYSTEIKAVSLQMLDSKPANGQSDNQPAPQQQQAARQPAPSQHQGNYARQPAPSQPQGAPAGGMDFDDDIPF